MDHPIIFYLVKATFRFGSNRSAEVDEGAFRQKTSKRPTQPCDIAKQERC